MNRLMRLAGWIWRAWPVIVMGLLIAAHWMLVRALPDNTASIHKWTSASAQGIGGLVVIYSLSQNLGLFGKGGLWAVFIQWLREFPWTIKKATVASGTFPAMELTTDSVEISGGAYVGLEGRLLLIEQKLKMANENQTRIEQTLKGEIEQLRGETKKSLQEGQATLVLLSENVKEAAVGGFMPQLFGVMLALYGTGLGAYIQP